MVGLDRVLKDIPWPCRSYRLRYWDAAIANYPGQQFTLRNGILVIRQYPRGEVYPYEGDWQL